MKGYDENCVIRLLCNLIASSSSDLIYKIDDCFGIQESDKCTLAQADYSYFVLQLILLEIHTTSCLRIYIFSHLSSLLYAAAATVKFIIE